jgi:hypothetical protein
MLAQPTPWLPSSIFHSKHPDLIATTAVDVDKKRFPQCSVVWAKSRVFMSFCAKELLATPP